MNHSRSTLEQRVSDWIATRLGESHGYSPERAMRVLEEAIELAQSEGIGIDLVKKQVDHVFARPAGTPLQEAAGVAVCLLGWCSSNHVSLNDIATAEIERIEAKPLSTIRGSLARKSDADLVVIAASVPPRTPERAQAEQHEQTTKEETEQWIP